MRLYSNEAWYNPELTETVKYKRKENGKKKKLCNVIGLKK